MRGITEFTPLKGKNSPVKSIKSRETEQVRPFPEEKSSTRGIPRGDKRHELLFSRIQAIPFSKTAKNMLVCINVMGNIVLRRIISVMILRPVFYAYSCYYVFCVIAIFIYCENQRNNSGRWPEICSAILFPIDNSFQKSSAKRS